MKRYLQWLLVPLLALTLAGCAAKTNSGTVTPPPPAGSLNSFDAATNTTLQTLHAFVASMVNDNNTGKITLTVSQKAILNQLVQDVNVADAVYQAWHAAGGTGSTTTVTSAVTKAQGDQTSLTTALGGK